MLTEAPRLSSFKRDLTSRRSEFAKTFSKRVAAAPLTTRAGGQKKFNFGLDKDNNSDNNSFILDEEDSLNNSQDSPSAL